VFCHDWFREAQYAEHHGKQGKGLNEFINKAHGNESGTGSLLEDRFTGDCRDDSSVSHVADECGIVIFRDLP